jgi:hypothetical protein
MASDIKLKDFILYNCRSIKEKGLVILNVIDNIKWKLGVLHFHSAYARAATADIYIYLLCAAESSRVSAQS